MIGSFKEMDKKRQKYDAERPAINLNNPIFQSIWFAVFGSILSGVLLALGFPGFGNSTLIFVALVPLMFAVQGASIKKASWLALLSGFVFFMMSLSWLHNLTGTVEGVGMKASALVGYALLALYCGLYFIPFAITVTLGVQRWAGENVWKNVRFMFAVTMVWVGAEYVRGFLLTGFPWNPLGVSQYANPTIIQIAEWGGVSIVSAYIVWMNAGAFITFRQYTHGSRMKKYRPHFELMIGIVPLALSIAHGMNVLFNRPEFYESVNVALVQPNIPQVEKWDTEMDQMIRDRLAELGSTALRLEGIDLMIWPETAVPDFLRTSRASYDLVKSMTATGTPLLLGSMDVEFTEAGRIYYNSSMLFGKDGEELGKYDKQHLVPFGEYVPFPGLMRKFTPIEVDFRHGAGSTILPLRGNASFSALICFEDIVAPLSVNATRAGARWLVSQSNDAWFDPSAQSEQHLAHAIFRCIENRIPMARCCNTGVSCIIDAYGNVQRNLEPLTKGFTTGQLHPRPIGLEKTFYTRNGNVFSKVALIAGATVLFVLRSKGWKFRRKKDVPEVE
ncbi:Apolipoprotein N-acyltransferase [Pontiella desulfatans]|uniref:Apolipoprotein N-acyltransferase n=1 Tax=Pontiella desulfatans TaxID=2750659 RepID=A0A6C2UAK7_PONDE|nr:apolipoprotein N-acyltransferase [Pontiella desulfatans]VGO17162.1 Apolipoprotein N-acyltransferase [Pontiella desulfatans]